MRRFFIITLFSFLSCQAFASEFFEEPEKLMKAYINCPTGESLGKVYESLLTLKCSELISLDICSSKFKNAMYTHIKDLPNLPSRVSYFNFNEPVYRNFILILSKLMPHLQKEEIWVLKYACETYATQSSQIPNEVKTAFEALGERYSFNVRELSITEAAFLCFKQGRYIDCMGYGVHVLDTFTRQHTSKVAGAAALLVSLGVYSTLF